MDGKRRQHRDTATTRLFQKCFLPIHSRPSVPLLLLRCYYYDDCCCTSPERGFSPLFFALLSTAQEMGERAANSRHTHTQKPRNVIYVQNRVETLKHGNSSNSVEKGVVQRREGGVVVWAKNLLPSQLLAPQQQPEGGSCCTQEEEDFGAPSGK